MPNNSLLLVFLFVLFKLYIYFFLFKILLIYFRQSRREGEREGEKHQCVVASHTPPLGTWPATQSCALTGNVTSDPLVHSLVLNPLSHMSQGQFIYFLSYYCYSKSHTAPFPGLNPFCHLSEPFYYCCKLYFLSHYSCVPIPYSISPPSNLRYVFFFLKSAHILFPLL